MTPDEEDMLDRVRQLALEFRLDRVATYRQLQATSNALSSLTGGRTNLNSFVLPEDVHIRPPEQNEVRVVVNEEGYACVFDFPKRDFNLLSWGFHSI